MLLTRPVRSAYSPRALSSSAVEAPGKFVVENIPKAGSFVSTPNPIVGTICWLSAHTLPKKSDVPKLRLWLPRCQFNVLSMFQLHALRAVGLFWLPAFVSAWLLLAEICGKERLCPPCASNVWGPLLASSPKYE